MITRTKVIKKTFIALLIGVSCASLANHHGESKHAKTNHHEQADAHLQKTKTLNLSSQLLTLLNQEMQQIKVGMESLVYANVSGDWKTISKVGHNIKHSYIMAQKLTKHQRHELHQSLPQGFKTLDKKLHYYAGMLSHVAKEHDGELVNYYIYKMNETCTACHAQYATHKFPGFLKNNKHQAKDNHSDKH